MRPCIHQPRSILLFLLILLALPASLTADLFHTRVGNTIVIWGGNLLSFGLVIPPTIQGLPVTTIGQSAFASRAELPSVTIPDSVTSIEQSAFANCSRLTSTTFGNGLSTIGQSAFANCVGLATITIPDSVTSIEQSAFANCTGLTSVTLGNGLTNIGPGAFANCTGLTNITIPDSVSSIGQSAFSNCKGLVDFTVGVRNPTYSSLNGILFNNSHSVLVSVLFGVTGAYTIPDGVITIGSYSFANCTGLTNITIPDSVTTIGQSAFSNCNGLTEVKIGKGLTNIGQAAFWDCSGLTSISLPDNVTAIGQSAFAYCKGLSSITIPDKVTTIEQYAFDNCKGLTSVTFSKGLTSVGKAAFWDCSGLTSITIPDHADPDVHTSISELAFAYCTNLTEITFGNTVTSIGVDSFVGCPNLRRLYFRGDAPRVPTLPSIITDSYVTVYYDPTTAGWGSTFAGHPAIPYVPQTAPTLAPVANATFTVGLPFSYTISANGSPTLFTATGLPIGLTLDPLTGVISGIPATEGTHTVTITASNTVGIGTQVITITVLPPAPVLAVYAVATVGLSFRYNIIAYNTPTLFGATGLPLGLSLDPLTGVITGTPVAEGTHIITLSASNASGTDRLPLLLTINPASKINFDPVKDIVVLTLQTGENKEQLVEYSDDLKQWTRLGKKLAGTKDLSELDPQASTRPFRFYRVIPH